MRQAVFWEAGLLGAVSLFIFFERSGPVPPARRLFR